MTIPTRKHCTDDEYQALSNEKDLVIKLYMDLDGEQFNDAMVIENYKNLSRQKLMEEIEEKGNILIKLYSRVLAGRAER